MKLRIPLVLLFSILLVAPVRADINDLLNGLGSRIGNAPADSTAEAVTRIGTALGIIPENTVDINYLIGTWNYSEPAVSFKSQNFLKKAGGVAASKKIESELAPYFKRLGLTGFSLTVNADSTFTLSVKSVKLSGSILPDPAGKTLRMSLSAFGGRIPMGSMTAYASADSQNALSLTFDVEKLIDLIRKLSVFTGNSTLQAASKILESYDGITAGFRLKKVDSPSSQPQNA